MNGRRICPGVSCQNLDQSANKRVRIGELRFKDIDGNNPKYGLFTTHGTGHTAFIIDKSHLPEESAFSHRPKLGATPSPSPFDLRISIFPDWTI